MNAVVSAQHISLPSCHQAKSPFHFVTRLLRAFIIHMNILNFHGEKTVFYLLKLNWSIHSGTLALFFLLRLGLSLAVPSLLALLACHSREGRNWSQQQTHPKEALTQRFRAQAWQSHSFGFETWLQPFPAGWAWASLLFFLSHSFLICEKEEIITVPWQTLFIASLSSLPTERQFFSGITSHGLWGGGPSFWNRREHVLSLVNEMKREIF